MNREFVLVASGAYVKFDTLSALDAAFDAACERNPVGVQITAETYRTVSGQGIGRTHAYRLVDGRVFRRSLDNWQDAELAEVSHVERPYHAIKDDPRLLIPAAAGMLRADKVWTKDGWRKAPAPMPGVHEADRRRGPVSWLHQALADAWNAVTGRDALNTKRRLDAERPGIRRGGDG
jgi:hypothetical protein